MTALESIRKRFRAGELDREKALQELAPHLHEPDSNQVLGEILGMVAEPEEMSDEDRQAAEMWENSYRGK